MKPTPIIFVLQVAMMLTYGPIAFGEEAATPSEAAAPKPAPLTVAVLDFDVGDIVAEDLGAIIGQTVTIMLAGEPGFELVERASLQQILEEHELNLTGLVDNARAVEVGKLVGARILIVGRVFQLGQRTFMAAKIIGVETTLVDGVLVQGEAGDAIDELVMTLAQRLAERLPEAGPRLVALHEAIDPLPALRAKLKDRQLPRVAVVITEEHLSRRRPAPVPDPAAETEVKRVLRDAGITVQDVTANALTNWARASRQGESASWPQDLAAVDLVISGEAFSEFAAEIGNLQSAVARVEINVIERSTGQIIFAGRTTSRAVDLAENIAGKSALQKGGRTIAIELLEHLAEHLPAAETTDGQAAP